MWKGVRKAKQRLGPSQGAVHWREPAGGRAQQTGEGRQGNQTGKQAAVPAPARQPEPRTQVKTGAGGSEGPLRTSHAY